MPVPLKVIFAGTPDFSVAPLLALIESHHEVIAVYTQPDRPAGRGRALKPGPVKAVAMQHDIPVYQPLNFKQEEDLHKLEELQADIMIVVAYGLILPQRVLDAPRLGCLNIHASLLPRWRGAAPIQRCIQAGDEKTGITIMQMEAGLDTGPMLHVEAIEIGPRETGGELHDRLAPIGAQALMTALDKLQANQLSPQQQDDALANYAHKLEKQQAKIDWQQPAVDIDRMVRAFNPWPVAFSELDGKPLRVWQTQLTDSKSQAQPGTIEAADANGLAVATADNLLLITQLQPAGKRMMATADFVNAHDVTGQRFAFDQDAE